MSAIAIITARGGSKRIPRKNIRPFLGQPVISYCIRAARESGIFDEVMVSTDDAEIADIAKQYGAAVPFLRSPENAGDFSTTADVIKEVIDQYTAAGKTFDYTCCIYPTAALLQPVTLQNGLALLKQGDYDSVVPVIRYGHPILRSFKMEDHTLSMLFPENELKRSQDLAPAFHDSGQFYWLHTAHFMESGRIFSAKTGGLEIPDNAAQDIDNETDWKLAELKYRLLHE